MTKYTVHDTTSNKVYNLEIPKEEFKRTVVYDLRVALCKQDIFPYSIFDFYLANESKKRFPDETPIQAIKSKNIYVIKWPLVIKRHKSIYLYAMLMLSRLSVAELKSLEKNKVNTLNALRTRARVKEFVMELKDTNDNIVSNNGRSQLKVIINKLMLQEVRYLYFNVPSMKLLSTITRTIYYKEDGYSKEHLNELARELEHEALMKCTIL